MAKLIYIASSPHSGSTLLEMLLSAHPAINGLGETRMLIGDDTRDKYIKTAHSRICSCQKPIDECKLWSKFIQYIQDEASGDFGVRYKYLVNLAYQEFGSHSIISDSSKYLAPLRQLVGTIESGQLADVLITKDDLLVLHLIKDVRSYVTSIKRRQRLTNLQFKNLIFSFYKWCRDNTRMSQYLETKNIPSVKVSYEALCFDTETILRQVCNEAQIEFDPKMLKLSNSNAHIGLGNPMRTHEIKSKKIIYDYRWFYHTNVHLLYYLLPGAKKCNENLLNGSFLFEPRANLFEPSIGQNNRIEE